MGCAAASRGWVARRGDRCARTRAHNIREAQNVRPSRWRPSMPFWKSMPRGKGKWTKQSMSFVPRLRCTWAAAVGSSSDCPGEALVGLLIERGSTDDLAEAHRIVDQWQAQRPGIPALDLWWLKSRALLAKAEGDSDGYAELANQYLAAVRKARRPRATRRGAANGEPRSTMMAMILAYTSPALGSPIADQRTAGRAVPPWSHGPCADAFHRCRDRPTARLRRGRDRSADRGDRARRLEGDESRCRAEAVGRGIRRAAPCTKSPIWPMR